MNKTMVDRNYCWECITEKAKFAPRDGAGAVVFGGRIWLLGGWNPADKVNFPNVCNSEVWSSKDGRDWVLEVKEAPWEGRHTAGNVVHNDKIWVVGGDCIQKYHQSDIWNSTDGINWECVCESAPWSPRVLHYTIAFAGYIWVIGGQTMPGFVSGADEVFYNDVWRSVDGKNWECVLDSAPWKPRGMIGGSATHNGKICLLGGGTYDTPATPERTYYNEVWQSADGISWEIVTQQAPWLPRQYHDVAVFDNALWVLEGYNKRNLNDVWFSTNGKDWTEIPDTPWNPRHASSIFVFNEGLYVVTGNNMESDVWKLRII